MQEKLYQAVIHFGDLVSQTQSIGMMYQQAGMKAEGKAQFDASVIEGVGLFIEDLAKKVDEGIALINESRDEMSGEQKEG